jgi:hypothetical protein
MPRPRLRPLALCPLVLAGCAIPSPSPPAGTQYDGTYIGQDSLVSGVDFQCGAATLEERLDIRGGRFDYPFQVSPPRVASLPVQIAINGAMAGQMQYGTGDEIREFSRDRVDWVYLRGGITGTTMDATISNIHCVRRLIAERS